MTQREPACWHWQGVNQNLSKMNGFSHLPPAILKHQLWHQSGIQVHHIKRCLKRKMTPKQWQQWLYHFTQDWLTLLRSGVSQLDCFETLSTQARHRQTYYVVQEVIRCLHQGHSLHHSLNHSKGRFPPHYCRLVEAGEYSGQLIRVLEQLTLQLKAQLERQKKIRKALTYPGIVLITASIVVVLMLYLIVPQFAVLYEQMNTPLPDSTRHLLALADTLLSPLNWLWLLLLFPVIAFFRRLLFWVRKYKKVAQAVYLIPLLGRIFRIAHLEQDLRLFCLATGSQLPINDACRLSAMSSSSALLQGQWQVAEQQVKSGSALTQAFQKADLFDYEDILRIEIGEKSGQLNSQLTVINERLVDALNRFEHRMLASVEPVLLMLTGAVCASILLALYTPLFQIGQLVG